MRHAAGDRAPGLSGYDAELQLLDVALRRAIGAGPATTSSTSAVVPGGRPGTSHVRPGRGGRLGARDRARREPARAEGVRNATFEHADAQTHRFPPERFDLAMSRFGTMFFADPVAGFAHLGRALRPAGRLVMTVWQAHERNAWDVAIRRSLQAAEGPAAGAPDRPAPPPPPPPGIPRGPGGAA